jgi:hypothetical protein
MTSGCFRASKVLCVDKAPKLEILRNYIYIKVWGLHVHYFTLGFKDLGIIIIIISILFIFGF